MTNSHNPDRENLVPSKKRSLRPWIYDVLLVYVLILAAFFRISGIFWGEYSYMHPDERFLVWVGSDISPVKDLAEYFDTSKSSLNPHNFGHGFYVYGTLPMFITRYAVDWIFGHSGFDEMTQVGRTLSAVADLFTVLLVYLVAKRLYDKRVAILAAAFSGATVLQIQQSHFFTMDTFITAFSFLAFYFAVRIQTIKEKDPGEETPVKQLAILRSPLLWFSVAFGVALGLAVASKINAAPMAATLPLAFAIILVRTPPEHRTHRGLQAFAFLIIAAILSLLVFRIFQPYAFSGPGFLGIKLNPLWMDNMRELVAQSSPEVDYPPSMQWARRPVWFSLQNMVMWGFGPALGVLAWAGFLWVGWRMLQSFRKRTDEWQSHALIWTWTAAYFIWQSFKLNPTMRYQLPVYPTLVIFAGWAIVALFNFKKRSISKINPNSNDQPSTLTASPAASPLMRLVAILVGTVALISSSLYAFAFSQMYVRPFTRVDASRWIYQNIPGPVTLSIQTSSGVVNQPLSLPYSFLVTPKTSYNISFQPKVEGNLEQLLLAQIKDLSDDHIIRSLVVTLYLGDDPENPLAMASLTSDFSTSPDPQSGGYKLELDRPVALEASKSYRMRLSLEAQSGNQTAESFQGNLELHIDGNETEPTIQPVGTPSALISSGSPYEADFTAYTDGSLNVLNITYPTIPQGSVLPDRLSLTLQNTSQQGESSSSGMTISSQDILTSTSSVVYVLDQPLSINSGENYHFSLVMQPQGGALSLSGMGIATEGDWDDGLPLRMDGYDGYGGIYPQDLGFNMYTDDNAEKLARFTRILDQADYIVISSSRQWGSLTRIPERFPMTTLYYRNLIGCPDNLEIETCYRNAEPGMFNGNLGFELTKVFESPPSIGGIRLNDQYAEEAFTVYDHPKVFVFKKMVSYNSDRVEQIFSSLDFSQVLRIAPMKFDSRPANLLLPETRLAEQRLGGTWSELFDTQSLFNRYPALAVLLWYLVISLLGLIMVPILRLALPGLNDRGYPLARMAGMLLLSYLVWIAASIRTTSASPFPFTRLTISIVVLIILSVGGFCFYKQRHELALEWRTRKKYFLIVEGITLAFFITFLLIRLGNPDLWHPWKGGEKPMDFAYFNAVLKSTSFPPYDPWYAGGYLNYYYYGFVLFGVPVKWLGIVPSIGYNLILPTVASLMGMGAFSVVWNLTQASRRKSNSGIKATPLASPWIPAIAAAIFMVVLGNLGTVRMFFQGYQKLVAPNGVIESASLPTHWIWAIRGFIKAILGENLPYSIGDWYWIPSRVIPAPNEVEPITEFPFFTLLYGDPHAHLFALPVTLLALSFPIAIILGKARWSNKPGILLWFFLSGLSIGALRPTNTWDFPLYLVLGVLAAGYAYGQRKKALLGAQPWLAMVTIACLAFLLYQPYAQWYSLAYTKVNLWEGTHTPTNAYLTHWGLFLFLIIAWMVWYTWEWMATTPVSSLRKLYRQRGLWITFSVLLTATVAILLLLEVFIAWFVLPLAALAGIMLFRSSTEKNRASDESILEREPSNNDVTAQRIVLFLFGTSLVLTIMVEVIVLAGDIGRMNTVFKFYLQVWTLLAICAATSLGWLLTDLKNWALALRRTFQVVLVLLIAGASLYTLTATMAKIDDRIAPDTPHTLDGMAYMPYATFTDEWGEMDLNQDYEAIRWMQENVQGSPVIVEANLRNLYRWGSRFSIYTGLPSVVGWEWHEQQQRATIPGSWISARIAEVDAFYETTDLQAASSFLRKYTVRYIIVGQQERGHYTGPGLEKFEAADGVLWDVVFRSGDTVIYEVRQDGL